MSVDLLNSNFRWRNISYKAVASAGAFVSARETYSSRSSASTAVSSKVGATKRLISASRTDKRFTGSYLSEGYAQGPVRFNGAFSSTAAAAA